MKKKTMIHVLDAVPDLLKNTSDWLKRNLEDNGKEILDNASGTIGLIIKLFGKPLVDKYFDKLSIAKIKDFGAPIYLKAAYIQAANSMEIIEGEIKSQNTPEEVLAAFSDLTQKEFLSFAPKDVLLIFQPVYHPIITLVKQNYVGILDALGVSQNLINTFNQHFNNNISTTIEREFGADYSLHLKDIEQFICEENEAKLLLDTFHLRKIGFDSNENLKYEETYGFWKEVQTFKLEENEALENETISNFEKELVSVKNLIKDYFGNDQNNSNKILFVIADFGKGKSVFLKRYASELALNYLNNKEGYFPIYFNLREFRYYEKGDSLGVINDYLLTKYGIDIRQDYYSSKKYMFLIDSLDECGELSKENIDKVIYSVKQILNIDRTKYKKNRIVLTSRPINEGLEQHLRLHEPYSKQDSKTKREIDYFISLYGFKKSQFNNWLRETLTKSNRQALNVDTVDFVKNIYANLEKRIAVDIYSILRENNTLGYSELRRPIFAYMIYQLIVNNIDFLKVGKIGVYLSFINLLTKDAKHIKDPLYKVKLEEEFQFRNILHATSALWMYESRKGEQAHLKKADLCRTIEGKQYNENDAIVLTRNKQSGISEIEFLSHSYFGENSDTLHFQHQSFAEILLAEYYLKIFIKYALDKYADIEEACIKLHLGKPTEQTIHFFIELITLLKETVCDIHSFDASIMEKRKLLFPLFASMANETNNTLFSHNLHYSWYNLHCKFIENQIDYPQEALENWCINESHLHEIENLAAKIINNEQDFILTKTKQGSSLFDYEVAILLEKTSSISNNIDKWLSLITGNYLYNNLSSNKKPKLFNNDYNIKYQLLFNLITSVDYADREKWMYPLFKGINMKDNQRTLSLSATLNKFDLSYSRLNKINFEGAILGDVNFDYCHLLEVNFGGVFIWGINMDNTIMESSYFGDLVINGDILVRGLGTGFMKYEARIIYIPFSTFSEYSFHQFQDLIKWLEIIKKYPLSFGTDEKNLKKTLRFNPLRISRFLWEAIESEIPLKEYFNEKREIILKKVYHIENDK